MLGKRQLSRSAMSCPWGLCLRVRSSRIAKRKWAIVVLSAGPLGITVLNIYILSLLSFTNLLYSVTVIGHNPDEGKTRVKLPSGAKKVIKSSARGMIGIVAGGGRTDKPLLSTFNIKVR